MITKMSDKTKTAAQIIGKHGEDIASGYLTKKGLNVIFRNFHTRYGEIDIIARDSQYIIFAEVKTRNEFAVSVPSEWVDKRKQKKLMMTAALYLQNNPTDLQPRFDVIEVVLAKGSQELVSINHIENAFIQEDSYAAF